MVILGHAVNLLLGQSKCSLLYGMHASRADKGMPTSKDEAPLQSAARELMPCWSERTSM